MRDLRLGKADGGTAGCGGWRGVARRLEKQRAAQFAWRQKAQRCEQRPSTCVAAVRWALAFLFENGMRVDILGDPAPPNYLVAVPTPCIAHVIQP